MGMLYMIKYQITVVLIVQLTTQLLCTDWVCLCCDASLHDTILVPKVGQLQLPDHVALPTDLLLCISYPSATEFSAI